MSHSLHDFLQSIQVPAAETRNHNHGHNQHRDQSSRLQPQQQQRNLYEFFPTFSGSSSSSPQHQRVTASSSLTAVAAPRVGGGGIGIGNSIDGSNNQSLLMQNNYTNGSVLPNSTTTPTGGGNIYNNNHHRLLNPSTTTPSTSSLFPPFSSDLQLRMIDSILHAQRSNHHHQADEGSRSNNGLLSQFDFIQQLGLHQSNHNTNAATVSFPNSTGHNRFHHHHHQQQQQQPHQTHQQRHQQHSPAETLFNLLSPRHNNNNGNNPTQLNINAFQAGPSMAVPEGHRGNDAGNTHANVFASNSIAHRNFHLPDTTLSIDHQAYNRHHHNHRNPHTTSTTAATPTAAAVAAATAARLNAVESLIDRAASAASLSGTNMNISRHHHHLNGAAVRLGSGVVELGDGAGGGYNETDSLWRHHDLHAGDDDVDSIDSANNLPEHPIVTTSSTAPGSAATTPVPSSSALACCHSANISSHSSQNHKAPSSILMPSTRRRTRSMSSRLQRTLPFEASRNSSDNNTSLLSAASVATPVASNENDTRSAATTNGTTTTTTTISASDTGGGGDSALLSDFPSSSSSVPTMTTNRRRTRSQLRRHRNVSEISSTEVSSVKRQKVDHEAKKKSATSPSSKKKIFNKKDDNTSNSSSKSNQNNCKETKSQNKKEDIDESNKCCICLDIPTSTELAKIDACSHPYCFGCIEEWAKRENTCPQCKARFSEIRRVNKLKQNRRKKGSSGFKNNVKKVKDRNQRSDFRQLNQLQNLFASIDANGLNILLSSGHGLFHEAVPNFLHQAAVAAAASGSRSARSPLRNNDISLNSFGSVSNGATAFRGTSHQQMNAFFPLRSAGERLPGSLSPSMGAGAQQLHRPASIGNLNTNEDMGLDSSLQTNRRSRLYRRGVITRLNIDTSAVASQDSLLMHAMRGTNHPFFGPNDRRISNTATFNGNESIALSDVAFFDFPDPFRNSSSIFSDTYGPTPRSFAANTNQTGAGLSADRALEIMDDDSGSETM